MLETQTATRNRIRASNNSSESNYNKWLFALIVHDIDDKIKWRKIRMNAVRISCTRNGKYRTDCVVHEFRLHGQFDNKCISTKKKPFVMPRTRSVLCVPCSFYSSHFLSVGVWPGIAWNNDRRTVEFLSAPKNEFIFGATILFSAETECWLACIVGAELFMLLLQFNGTENALDSCIG